MRRILLVSLRLFIACGLLLILVGLTVWAYPPLGLLGVAILNQSRPCPLSEILRGADHHYREQQIRDRLMKSIRVKSEQDGMQLWQTEAGDFWFPTGTRDVAAVLVAQQAHDLYSVQKVSPSVVIDCGAHVGLFTKRALWAGATRVIAIEPAPENLKCLRLNLAAEIADGRVLVIAKGVWDREETLAFYSNANNSAGDSFVSTNGNEKPTSYLPLTTIDRIATEALLPRVDLIKMDIKGAVVRALKGGSRVLREDRPALVISTEEEADEPVGVEAAIHSLGLGYNRACGSCTFGRGGIWPTVLFFHPNRS